VLAWGFTWLGVGGMKRLGDDVYTGASQLKQPFGSSLEGS